MSKAKILIVEDKFIVAQDIAVSLKKLGYSVCGIADSSPDALEAAESSSPDLVLMDIRLKGDTDGIATAALIQERQQIPVIYLTAHSDEATLERAASTEPAGYLLKPFDERQLYTTIELALNRSRTMRDSFLAEHPEVLDEGNSGAPKSPNELSELASSVRVKEELSGIICESASMLELLHNVELVANTDVSVHIYGENGTGKELIADAVHRLSSRKSKPFVKLNCSAIPQTLLESSLFGHTKGSFTGANKDQEGFLERAQGGTLFLDEIGDISQDIQVKLLRVLQNREYCRVGETVVRQADIRVITATNRNLKELVAQGKIREDFFYRIHVFPIEVPPLRERENDVLRLVEHFRLLFNQMFKKKITTIHDDARVALLRYTWPGNVRELENVMRRAFVLTDGFIALQHLPKEIRECGAEQPAVVSPTRTPTPTPELQLPKVEDEREKILAAIRESGGNRSKAAELLGYSRVTLWKKLNSLRIDVNEGLE